MARTQHVDYPLLQRLLTAISPLTAEEMAALWEHLTIASFAPGQAFVQVGERSKTLGVVLRGLFRVYYLTEAGQHFVRRFVTEGRIIGDIGQQLTGDPARVTIDALEASDVAIVDYAVIEDLYERYPAWQRFGRKLMERYYLMLERREHEFLVYPAAQRYQVFRSDYPGLEERVSQANIASYLGINPVTLSRIRSRKANKVRK